MATPFQNINKVVQYATSDARQFAEDLTPDEDGFTSTTEDEMAEAADDYWEIRDLSDHFKDLYYIVFNACIETFLSNE